MEVGRGLFFVCEKVVVGGDEARASTSEISRTCSRRDQVFEGCIIGMILISWVDDSWIKFL